MKTLLKYLDSLKEPKLAILVSSEGVRIVLQTTHDELIFTTNGLVSFDECSSKSLEDSLQQIVTQHVKQENSNDTLRPAKA